MRRKRPMPIKIDTEARIQFQIAPEKHKGTTFRQPKRFYLTKNQVYSVDYLFEVYEQSYEKYPNMKPFVLLHNPRLCEQDYTEKQKKTRGIKSIRLVEYLQRRGIEVPPEFFEKYGK